jgi:hypothetical protein
MTDWTPQDQGFRMGNDYDVLQEYLDNEALREQVAESKAHPEDVHPRPSREKGETDD